MKTILVTGADGYCGWPTILRLLSEIPMCKVIGVDNQSRREWVKEIGSDSVIPIYNLYERSKLVDKDKLEVFKNCDLTDYNIVNDLFTKYKPDIVLHLASQPSAPYSHIDIEHCNFTQHNNLQMLRNILWSLNNNKMDRTHLVVTTTTGIYGAPSFRIPEGNLDIVDKLLPYPSMGGSWYHMSRAHDAANLWLANKQFNFPITEMRTSIVVGSSTRETRVDPILATRTDVDFYFGVVTNRFVAMALKNEPLTIYGKGLQGKPMISLEDMVKSMVDICKVDPTSRENKYEIYNQMEKVVPIVDIAQTIKATMNIMFGLNVEIKHIPNPRIEDESHHMEMDNFKFKKLIGGKFICPIEQAVSQMCSDLYKYKDRIGKFSN